MDHPIEQPDQQLGFLLTQVSFLKQRIINAGLKELDITYIQFVILAGILELADSDVIVSQQTIVDKRQLDKAMVSVVLKGLINRGLVIRQPHPTDKRAYTLTLSDEGRQKALKGKEITLEIDRRFFAKVNKKSLISVLIKLLKNKED